MRGLRDSVAKAELSDTYAYSYFFVFFEQALTLALTLTLTLITLTVTLTRREPGVRSFRSGDARADVWRHRRPGAQLEAAEPASIAAISLSRSSTLLPCNMGRLCACRCLPFFDPHF